MIETERDYVKSLEYIMAVSMGNESAQTKTRIVRCDSCSVKQKYQIFKS